MIALLLLWAAPQMADPAAASLLGSARSRLSAGPAERADPGARFRIQGEASVEDGKTRALNTTGGQCQVVGARMCTKPPRTWLKTPLGD
ncbi:hypothetical protein [Sphingomonas sp. BK235]|jgi:hypothetical protein|uniref:hypothetical protein n=1 Tax=Sphingomonas sp. BK235 TaxID=2512131 RepID=UPI0010517EF7|nr:hypothetical protein [Sphingomonas sp. BK235]TCP37136.1 hypothetical protein EV292_101644 [Sphingomonas sp. BK235]